MLFEGALNIESPHATRRTRLVKVPDISDPGTLDLFWVFQEVIRAVFYKIRPFMRTKGV
jgi:hypothetical protein